ncbi:NADH dehydrogenase (ubiquinone) 24 kDa subunit [Desulfarculus baarsii DSM 2075]|uniref:NADH dehydrogenase (Ubiquinone) 24 kDa subunit n=1 Tax=Desulfarculus baarsii (strain ATCC 33931 / DSM 2075 / LMG 7858 / VKM B-1802 / 2st14) TaxID=644282 RepID=E1QH51_DESB2|nr:NAD(P)H-dependent oxidoreductase subunit E [Desulfarculus baarsii]ADK84894.1 NADH dehydrogenase (ubiquinone) 24 kDa subunit [Desulfarculus baarsii DSM 2075]
MSLAEKSAYTEMPADVTPEMLTKIDQICADYRGKPGALIPVLQACQGVVGYLPEAVQQRIADGLGMAGHEVFGVATFYSFFTMKPRGRNVVRVCLGTACYVRGGKETMDRLTQHLTLNADGTTEDRRFTVEGVRCLGACGVAPVVVINEDTHRKIMADSVINLVERYQ